MVSALKNFGITFGVSIIIFGLLAYFVSGFLIDGMGLAGGFLEPESIETTPTTVGGDETTGDESTVDFSAFPGHSFTALLVGTDYQPGVLSDYDLSAQNKNATGFPQKERIISADTVFVLHLNKEKGKIVYCSLPSNMKVTVDGLPMKLSEAYCKLGIDYFKDKVASLIGMNIDYYAITSIPNMAKLVDSIEGLNLNVPQKMSYSDPLQNLTIELNAGEQTLYGAKTLQLLRFNNYTTEGCSRESTAVNVVKAMLSKLTSASYYNQAGSLMSRMLAYVDTNFTDTDLADNLELIFAYSDFVTVDYEYPGSAVELDGTTYFEPSSQSARNFFFEYKFQG